MEREDFDRCAAQDSADNSCVSYMKEEHRGACLMTFCLCGGQHRRQGDGSRTGLGGGKTRRYKRLLRDQPSKEELYNREVWILFIL